MMRYAAQMPPTPLRRRFVVSGQVQGVGFRPFVFRIATGHALTGTVSNTSEGVFIEVQGPHEAVEAFGDDLVGKLPPLAQVVSCEHEDLPPVAGETDFIIVASSGGHGHQVLISPDMAVCDDCLADMRDPAGRRYRYPFTNCTNCGPRYTITRSIPYDRDKTSMACFPLCPACRAEYEDPMDRRFHAQPNACPVCGPRLWLTARDGTTLAEGDYAITVTAHVLNTGRIAAIKGLGGFHLACDATDDAAVTTLRERKRRPHKPLAVMVPDMDTVRRIAAPTPDEERLILSQERPIVLCRARDDGPLASAVSPDTDHVGVMLPYTPLHHVLFDTLADLRREGGTSSRRTPSASTVCALVMTSGNASNEPICLGNRESLRRLAHIADAFLLHDRDILIRTDDSVVRAVQGEDGPLFMRRARGFVPRPVRLPDSGPCVLATGPELKNTLCITRNDMAFVSQHIGDMHNLETLGFFREIAAHLADILQVEPEAVVRDLHPDYMTTRWAEDCGLPVLALQHHYAHAYSVLAENGHEGPALCVTLDGTGYGDDGTIWGGEFLYVDSLDLEHERLAHFSRLPLPGGETAIREPWRIAQGALWRLGMFEPDSRVWPWLPHREEASRMVGLMLDKGVNTPMASSCGRLFDAVSAMLGLCESITYEGQAAILLERIQDMSETTPYPCPLKDGVQPMVLDTAQLFLHAYVDWAMETPPGIIARRFHLGLIQGVADLAASLCGAMGLTTVGLSGGVMQNLTLAAGLPEALRARGLVPLVHRTLPPNDGCISLGQAAWGRRRLQRDNA